MTKRAVGAAQFKARCLALIDDVATTRRELVITKRGRPLAKLVPITRAMEADADDLIEFQDDLVSPIDIAWDACR